MHISPVANSRVIFLGPAIILVLTPWTTSTVYKYMTIFIIITLLFSGPSYGLDQLSLPGRYLRLLFISRDGRQTGRLNHILRKRQNVLYSIWYRQAWEIDHRIFDRIDRFL